MRIVQLTHPGLGRRVAVVEEPNLVLVERHKTTRELVHAAVAGRKGLEELCTGLRSGQVISYDEVYEGKAEWKLLPPYDHPEPARFYVTGTGLTHKASAAMRQAMHESTGPESDSMKMYRIGLEGGRPKSGEVGAAPEWFYKGTGAVLRAHNEALEVPSHGEDGGEEAEIAGVYQIGPDGTVYRAGLVVANEFSDHVTEARNYLYLASSKLRTCSIGPEMVIGGDLNGDVRGKTRILRRGEVVWETPLATGEANMCHTVANLEHHHFKHAAHRLPGDAHLHFFGADNFSFKDKFRLVDGDVMEISYTGFGRALRNPIRVAGGTQAFVPVKVL